MIACASCARIRCFALCRQRKMPMSCLLAPPFGSVTLYTHGASTCGGVLRLAGNFRSCICRCYSAPGAGFIAVIIARTTMTHATNSSGRLQWQLVRRPQSAARRPRSAARRRPQSVARRSSFSSARKKLGPASRRPELFLRPYVLASVRDHTRRIDEECAPGLCPTRPAPRLRHRLPLPCSVMSGEPLRPAAQ